MEQDNFWTNTFYDYSNDFLDLLNNGEGSVMQQNLQVRNGEIREIADQPADTSDSYQTQMENYLIERRILESQMESYKSQMYRSHMFSTHLMDFSVPQYTTISLQELTSDDIPTQSVDAKKSSKKRRKKHVCRACIHCKKAHLACDNARPCNRCRSLNKTDCVDVQHKRRGRPRLVPEKKKEDTVEVKWNPKTFDLAIAPHQFETDE